jgi:hypothetical protein
MNWNNKKSTGVGQENESNRDGYVRQRTSNQTLTFSLNRFEMTILPLSPFPSPIGKRVELEHGHRARNSFFFFGHFFGIILNHNNLGSQVTNPVILGNFFFFFFSKLDR